MSCLCNIILYIFNLIIGSIHVGAGAGDTAPTLKFGMIPGPEVTGA